MLTLFVIDDIDHNSKTLLHEPFHVSSFFCLQEPARHIMSVLPTVDLRHQPNEQVHQRSRPVQLSVCRYESA